MILIAGIGNVFCGDDAFGVEVARALSAVALPGDVEVVDFGIRGIDLAYAMLDPHELVILVDAVRRGVEPGTVVVLEPELDDDPGDGAMIETHEMTPLKVLRAVRQLGGVPSKVLVVGCEPADLGSEDEPAMGLSPAVRAAVPHAVATVQTLISRGSACTS